MATIGHISPHARRLRREMTDAERCVWSHLRNRQLGGFKFRRQETVGRYVAGFACCEARLILEVDGRQHSELSDAERTKDLNALGWEVLRFWNNDISQQTEAVLGVVLQACVRLTEVKPSPNPLPHVGEG